METIPYSRQKIDAADVNAVQQILVSDLITQGPKVGTFERAIADYCGAKYAVAVSSGSAALHLAALAAGFARGDEAITTPISFVATANCVLYVGASPIFADINYDTINIDPVCVEKLVTRKTKAILPVDFAGLPAAMERIRQIADRHRLIVIEDASHALGAEYRGGGRVGSCKFSDLTTFSFHPVKHITTGEGGCITTNSKAYYEKLKALRSHGIYRTKALQRRFGGWYYEMRDLGFNYRITDFQCALGMSQLQKIDSFIKRRTEIARQYDEAFFELGDDLKIPAQQIKGEKHVWHLYLLRLKLKNAKVNRRLLYEHLRSNGINVQVHYIPIYRQPLYKDLFRVKKVRCPNAERCYQEVLSLPIFPDLTEAQLNKTIETVRNFLKEVSSSGRRTKRQIQPVG